MKNRVLQKWKAEAEALEQPLDQLPAPLTALLNEAADVGWFCEINWEPELGSGGVELRPGLNASARSRLFDRRIGTELLELQEALKAAEEEFMLLALGGPDNDVERGRFLLGEVEAVLTFLSVEDEDAVDIERLSILKALYEDSATRTDVASALQNFATFAQMYRSELDGLGGFDVSLIGEALEVAAKLRRRARETQGAPARELWAALQFRNRIASLLCVRLQRAKVLIRFAFRHHPELVFGLASQQTRHQQGGTPTHSMIRELNASNVEGDIQDLAM